MPFTVDYQNALNQAILNLNVVALLNTGVAYTGADGKKYTFGYWNDTPLPGTTMAWQVYVWSIISAGAFGSLQGPPKLYFNPQGAFPFLPIGGRKFTVAANQVPGDTLAPGYPLSVNVMVPPPGASTNFEIASAFCVSSVVRFGHANAVNYSALSSVLVPDPYIFGSIATEAPPLALVPVGFKGEHPFPAS